MAKTRDNGDVDFALAIRGTALQWLSAATDPTYGYRSIQSADGSIPLMTWVHVAATYDVATSTRRLYVNGTQMSVASSIGMDVSAPMDGTGPVRIGNQLWMSSGGDVAHLRGRLDEVRIWSAARAAAEICADAGRVFVPATGSCG